MKLSRKCSLIATLTILMVAFQNCGQPAELIQVSDSSQAPGTFSSSLEIGAPTNGRSAGDSNFEPGVSELENTDNEDDIKWGFNDIVHEASCARIEASDVLLNVAEVVGDHDIKMVIKSADSAISIAQPSLVLQASASGEVKELRLILKDSGNYLLTMDEMVYGLKTPSGQTSGFKLKLGQAVKVEAGREYELSFNIDLNRQIVVAGQKCLLKPVLRSATLVAK